MYETVTGPKPVAGVPEELSLDIRPSARILIATPSVTDPTFHQSVILLAEHSTKGALGFIINKPASEKMGEIVTPSGARIPAMVRTWNGGPLESDTGIILHTQPELGSTDQLAEGLYICSSIDSLVHLMRADEEQYVVAGSTDPDFAASNPLRTVFRSRRLYQYRFVMGCSAWGPRQLEREMRQGLWLEIPYDDGLLFNTPWEELWSKAFATTGISPINLAPVHQPYLA